MKKALQIDFNVQTGERSGNIDPRDENLPCYGWQNINGANSTEIRLVEDDRDLSVYNSADGVKVLSGKEEINNAISNTMPVKYNAINQSAIIDEMRSIDQETGAKRGDRLVDKHGELTNDDLRVLKEKHGVPFIKAIKPSLI